MEAKPEMIVNSPASHRGQRGFDHPQRLCGSCPFPVSEEEQEIVGRWKLGCVSESAVKLVIVAAKMFKSLLQNFRPKICPGSRRRDLGKGGNDFVCGGFDILPARLPRLRNSRYQLDHPSATKTVLLGNVSGGKKRLLIGSQQN